MARLNALNILNSLVGLYGISEQRKTTNAEERRKRRNDLLNYQLNERRVGYEGDRIKLEQEKSKRAAALAKQKRDWLESLGGAPAPAPEYVNDTDPSPLREGGPPSIELPSIDLPPGVGEMPRPGAQPQAYGTDEENQRLAGMQARFAAKEGVESDFVPVGSQDGAVSPEASVGAFKGNYADYMHQLNTRAAGLVAKAAGAGIDMPVAKAKLFAARGLGVPPAKPKNSMDTLAEALITGKEKAKRRGRELGKQEVDYETSMRGQHVKAIKDLDMWKWTLSRMENIKEGGGAAGGPLTTNVLLPIRAMFNDLDQYFDFPKGLREMMPKLNVANAQVFQAKMFENLLGQVGSGGEEGGMPANNFSNKDLQFLIDANPNLSKDPAANRLLIQFMQVNAARTQIKAEYFNAWRAENPQKDVRNFELDWARLVHSGDPELAERTKEIAGYGIDDVREAWSSLSDQFRAAEAQQGGEAQQDGAAPQEGAAPPLVSAKSHLLRN